MKSILEGNIFLFAFKLIGLIFSNIENSELNICFQSEYLYFYFYLDV